MAADRSDFIPVYEPHITDREKEYVNDCLDTTWISSLGEYIPRFESGIADIVGVRHTAAVSNGTVALHLAFHCLGLGPGDEVLVPTFTYIASVNTIAQTGAKPVFVDSNPFDWLIDVEDARAKITPNTRAIMPVHLYGAVCDMEGVLSLAREFDLFVVEDCAEALGSTLGGKPAGSFGDVSTLSFFGNKTVTTGEGGMVCTDRDDLHEHMVRAKGQGQAKDRRYWHDIMGFNYRMTNICAAIGVAQLERFESILARKRAIADLYRKTLAGSPVTFQKPRQDVESSEWLVSLLLPEGADKDRVSEHMRDGGVDTRPTFFCAHDMPVFRTDDTHPVAEDISRRGLCLPSYPTMSDDMVLRVCEALSGAIES